MKTTILACHTIRREIERAIQITGCDFPVVWVESGLHLRPDLLRNKLQEGLDQITDADRVLLGFGYCGHAVVGLTSRDYELILPKVDDCITLLLGSQEARNNSIENGRVYFLTQGWLEGEANICKEYQSTLNRFGPQATERIYNIMLAHYVYLGLIDTGAYSIAAMLPKIKNFAENVHLKLKIVPGRDRYLTQWLTGPWDKARFLTIPPQTTITHSHLGLGDFSGPTPIQA